MQLSHQCTRYSMQISMLFFIASYIIFIPAASASSLGITDAQIRQILNTPTKVKPGIKKQRQKIKNKRKAKTKHFKATKISHQVTKKAKQMLRVPYRWGGTSPRGFDCSGLVQYSYKKVGVKLPRTAAAQYKATRRIKSKYTARGDLIFFHTRRSGKYVNHVGIYLGNGQFIHAPGKGKQVTISRLSKYWKRKMVGVGRTI